MFGLWQSGGRNLWDAVRGRDTQIVAGFFIVVVVVGGVLLVRNVALETPPRAPTDRAGASVAADVPSAAADPYPRRLIIDALGTDISIQNPESRAIADLDAALLQGAVRHPDSADFAAEGNIFLFGHSSHLPAVRNKNFQAFNGIETLVSGDIIRVESADREYRYRVRTVYQAKASKASVTLGDKEALLTLVTCNSFGSRDDRFIVEAEYIGVVPFESVD